MGTAEEIRLLIKSKYPLIYLETADEEYSLNQLREAASSLGLVFYRWSATGGLRRGENQNSYYQTNEPAALFKTMLKLAGGQPWEPGLYVLKDIHHHLKNPVILRLCKDFINLIKNRRDTLAMVSPEYKLPNDLEAYAVQIACGYPTEEEIAALIRELAGEFARRRMEVSLDNSEMPQLVRALRGLTLQQIKNILNQVVVADNHLCLKDLAAIETYKRRIYDQEGLLEFFASEANESIAGFHNLKRWLKERKGSFSPSAGFVLPPPRGVLLMGVQGCGKSLAARITAQELALPLYGLDLGKLYSSYIGQTEQNLRRALETVERLSPLCLWIDEIEKGLAVSDGKVDGGVSKRVLGTFLTWLQERKGNCFVVATANDIQALPPELLRKGRFDEIFFVDLPDREVREKLFYIHLQKRKLAPELFNCTLLAEAAAGFSGAEIEQAIISALYRANSRKQQPDTGGILEQIRATRPLSVLRREDITALRQWAQNRTVPV